MDTTLELAGEGHCNAWHVQVPFLLFSFCLHLPFIDGLFGNQLVFFQVSYGIIWEWIG